MRGISSGRWNELVEWALDPKKDSVSLPNASAREELALRHLRQMRKGLQFPHFQASQQLVERAKAIFTPPERTTVLARLLTPRAQLGFVRGLAVESVQLSFQANDRLVRVSYARLPHGWQVLGRIDDEGWTAQCGDEEFPCAQEGRFEFLVNEIESASVLLHRPEVTILIPSPEDLRRHDDL